MERYEILRQFHPIYSNDAPVFVLGAQLLKDNVNDECLFQLKFQNVGTIVVKAIKLYIQAYDAFGDLLNVGEYSLLDFNYGRDGIFGSDRVIVLKNNQTRNLEYTIHEIVLNNDSVLHVEDAVWEMLPETIPLSYKITDSQLMEQYRMENGKRTNFVVKDFGNYWYCTCGAVNHAKELNCHVCRKNKAEIEATYDLNALAVRLKERLDKEERKKQNRQKARKRVLLWGGSLAAVCLCLFLFVTQLVLPYKQYRQALAQITAGNYEEAYTELRELGSFFDSEKYLANFHALPVHIQDNTDAISMDMKYDTQGRLIEENSSFIADYQQLDYQTVYSYKDDKLISSVTETDTQVFNAVYSDDGKTVTCETYLKEKIHEDGSVDDADKLMYTYTLEFDNHYNVVSIKIEGDYEQDLTYTYEYDENNQLDVIRSEDEYDTYHYYYTDGMLDSVYEKTDSYTINYENELFYSTKLEPYVGWWYRNPWILFVEHRV